MRRVHTEETMPDNVRAACRLTTKVSQNLTSPPPADPIDDGSVIIGYRTGEVSPPDTSPPRGRRK